MTRGLYVVATGMPKRHREAIAFIMHARRMGIDVPIFVHTNSEAWRAYVPMIGQVAPLLGAPMREINVRVDPVESSITQDTCGATDVDYVASREFRTRMARQAETDLCLMMDTDMAFLKDPATIWDQLGDAPHGMCLDRMPCTKDSLHRPKELLGLAEEWDYMIENGYVSVLVPTFNGGLMLWRTCDESRELFDLWRAEWQRFRHRDQQAMSRVMRDRPDVRERMAVLDPRWNRYVFNMYYFRTRPPAGAEDVVVAHCHIAAKEIYAKEWKLAKEVVDAVHGKR